MVLTSEDLAKMNEAKESKPIEPAKKSRLYAVPVNVLRASQIAASPDMARPILTGTAVYGNDLVVATDSYRLAIFGQPHEKPATLLQRAYEADRSTVSSSKFVGDDTVLPNYVNLPPDVVKGIVKMAPGGRAAYDAKTALKVMFTQHDSRPYVPETVTARVNDAQIKGTPIGGDYVKFGSLLKLDGQPDFPDPYAVNADFVADIAKIGKLLNRGNEPVYVTCYGAVKQGATTYWYVNGDIASMVYVVMTVRISGNGAGHTEWSHKWG